MSGAAPVTGTGVDGTLAAAQEAFDALLVRAAGSAAYRELCRRVHGLDLPLFDVVDGPQLDALLDALDLDDAGRALDLGCGLGGVAEHVAFRTGCRVTGVDRAPGALACARRRTRGRVPGLDFVASDLGRLGFAAGSFDALLAVDVLYFLPDLEEVLPRLRELLAPGGRLGAFGSEVLAGDGGDGGGDDLGRRTRLARALAASGFEIVRLSDWSANEGEIWRRQMQALRDLAPAFVAEGNGELLRHRREEVERVLDWVEAGRVRRYFYLARSA